MTETVTTQRSPGRRINVDGRVSAPHAAAIAGVSFRQLDYWLRTYPAALAIDVDGAGEGTGTWRSIAAADVPKIHVVGALSQLGLAPNIAMLMDHDGRRHVLGALRYRLRRVSTAGRRTRVDSVC